MRKKEQGHPDVIVTQRFFYGAVLSTGFMGIFYAIGRGNNGIDSVHKRKNGIPT